MLFFRSLIFSVGYYFSGILAGTIAVIIWPIFPYSWRWRIVTCWNRFVLFWLRACCNLKHEVVDLRHRKHLPCVILSKHQSIWETMFLQYYFGPVSTILKKELLLVPFFGWGLASLRTIAIERSNPIQALKQVRSKGIETLKSGNNLLIFPEGTRVPFGQAGKYARSGADIASAAQAPIIPVAHNAGKFWPNQNFIKYPGTIRVVIGDEIDTKTLDRKELTQQVEDWIESKIATFD